ncbi:hypothetical protein [Oryzomonas rubra]|uniref:Uncharacterized protein n=1 Tax=Oryzomonas rubra TaxID=2509454 RepID=A0A5A9XBM3_9BACT|nr:hypothetical protein [Oryzomonas rubra]KAA0889845.1 hypothetical protein ET418_13825 [Oryzomonas rubra]
MVRYVVVSLLLGWDVVSYLQQKPEAAQEMMDRIIRELGKISKKSCRPEIIVVFGKLYNDDEDISKISFKQSRTVGWNHYYIMGGASPDISQAVDRKVGDIVKQAIQELLNNMFLFKFEPLRKQTH